MNEYDVSIIVPCYNEEKIIEESVKEIEKVMSQTIYSYEFIFIDDCSKDKTRDLIIKIIKEAPNRRYIFHKENIGRGGTVSEGIKISKGKIVGFLDIDLEVHARYIPSFIGAIQENFDVAIAFRHYNISLKPDSIIRGIVSHGYRWLVQAFLRLPIKDTEAGFKFFNKEKILPILDFIEDKRWFWDTEIMALAFYNDLKIKEIPVLFIRRFDKKSSVKLFKESIEYVKKLISFKRRLKNQNYIQEYWQKEAESFHTQYKGNTQESSYFTHRFLKERYDVIFKLLDVHQKTVLDVGCGDGLFMEACLNKGASEVIGVDYSQKMIDIAKEKLKSYNNTKIQLFCEDIFSLNAPKNNFDTILAIGLLDYIKDPKSILEKFFDFLKANGELIVTIPEKWSPLFVLRTQFLGTFLRKKILKIPPIITTLALRDAESLINETGFKIEQKKCLYKTMWIFKCRKV